MMLATQYHDATSIAQLIATIEQFDGACDSEFDSGFDELERQFAEFRLTFDDN